MSPPLEEAEVEVSSERTDTYGRQKGSKSINVIVAIIVLVAITVIIVGSMFLMLPSGSYSGASSYYSGYTGETGTTFSIPADPIEIGISATLEEKEARIDATYIYLLNESSIAKISLPYKTLTDIALTIDGVDVPSSEIPNYLSADYSRVSIELGPGTHTINLKYTVEGTSYYTINLPNNRYLRHLYVEIRITDDYTVNSGSLKPDSVKQVGEYTTYTWERDSTVVREDIYIMPATSPDVEELGFTYLSAYAALWFFTTGIVYAALWYGMVRANNLSVVAPVLGGVAAFVVTPFLPWVGPVVGSALMAVLLYLGVRENRKIQGSLILLSLLPLSIVAPYGSVIFVALIGLAIALVMMAFLPVTLGEKRRESMAMENRALRKELQRLTAEITRMESEIDNLREQLKKRVRECATLRKKLSQAKKAEMRRINHCPECGKEVSPEFSYCPHCGAGLGKVVTCPGCGSLISAEFRYCPGCGRENPEERKRSG